MTHEIYFNIASLEHMTKQPPDRRYALYCWEAYRGKYGVECPAVERGGHLGDFEGYCEAKDAGVAHSHPVYIRFFPDREHAEPSDDFIQDLKDAPPEHVRW